MSEEKKVKPGYKTTEFWLTLAALLVGAIMASGAVPDESGLSQMVGVAAVVLSGMGYTVSRGMAKKVILMFAIPTILLVTGCCQGHVRANAIDGLVNIVSDRHDKLLDLVNPLPDIDGDGKEDESSRAAYLRSTERLRAVLKEAKKD